MSELDGTQVTTLQRPANEDKEAWWEYWKAQGQSWRWEPEIDEARQEYLAERRKIESDYTQGIYPFKDIKLRRADIEWLLATHENGRGPVNWNDESQREREGLDLRGADLRGEDLSILPLARINIESTSDLTFSKSRKDELHEVAKIHLAGADLIGTHLEGADLNYARLERADLSDAHLERADLNHAHLENAYLYHAHLENAYLYHAHLEGTNLYDAHLEGAALDGAFFDSATNLKGIVLSNNKYGTVSLVDIHWGDVNVAVVEWSTILILGEENEAREDKSSFRYESVARAYRQLSVVLRNQGLNEHAARFTYRAQLMQRKVFWDLDTYAKWLGSLFLDLLSGYGYKPLRCFIAYLIVIFTFATAYFIIGHTVGPVLSPLGSVVFSMTSFHGRGFFPGGIGLDDPLTVLAALEAFVGLLIEVTFIATLTQRLFGK